MNFSEALAMNIIALLKQSLCELTYQELVIEETIDPLPDAISSYADDIINGLTAACSYLSSAIVDLTRMQKC